MNLFLQQFDNGHGSIDSLFDDPEFWRWLNSRCKRFRFEIFNGAYGPEDLAQETAIKVKKSEEKLLKPGNIMSETDFHRWLYVVTTNQYFSRVRKFRRSDQLRYKTPVEELDLPVYDETKSSQLLKGFLRFIEQYPEVRRNAIKLWLEDYSFRAIAKELKSTSSRCSHVTVAKWVNASINDFTKSLELDLPAVLPSGTRSRRAGVGQSIAGQ